MAGMCGWPPAGSQQRAGASVIHLQGTDSCQHPALPWRWVLPRLSRWMRAQPSLQLQSPERRTQPACLDSEPWGLWDNKSMVVICSTESENLCTEDR